MESRPEATCTSRDELSQLPHETLLHIFSFLNANEAPKMQQTNRFYNRLLDDHLFWHAKHNQDYPHTPFKEDAKNQYLAAYFYYKAKAHHAPDRQQIGMLKLNRLLKNHDQPWSQHYKGLLHFQGCGTKKNTSLGFLTLIDSLDNRDHRTAIKIAQILLNTQYEDMILFKQYMSLLQQARLDLMHQLINSITDHKFKNIHKLLARLHAHGIGKKADFHQAEKYYLSVPNNTSNDIGELARIRFDTLPSSLDYEQKAEQTINYLESLRNKIPNHALQSVIDYWSAYLELSRGNDDEAIRLLRNLPEFTNAALMLNALLAEQQQRQIDLLRLIDLMELQLINEDTTLELFRLFLIFSLPQDAVVKIRDLTDCDMILLANTMSAYYRDHFNVTTLAQDPYMVWWMQLAAQAGSIESLKALLSVKADNYPFVCYALGIIYEFGILNSEKIEPNHDKSEYYFSLACRHHRLDEYLLTGIGHDFACKEVSDFLESKIITKDTANKI